MPNASLLLLLALSVCIIFGQEHLPKTMESVVKTKLNKIVSDCVEKGTEVNTVEIVCTMHS
jgi:hypothetical protein